MDPAADMQPNAKGDFVKTPLAHLLVFMAERRLQGSLVLHGDDGSNSTIFLSGGVPSKVRTSYSGTYLGRVLLQLGFLDDATLKATTELVRPGAVLHGQLLVSMGKIDQAQLVAGLREQLMRRMIRLFDKLGDLTTYAFYSGINLLDDYGGPELTPVDPFRLIWEGVHVRPHDSHIEPTLARLGSAPIRLSATADLRRFGFGPPEGRVIDMLKARPMSVSSVMALDVMPVRQLKVLLYAMLITKSIELPASASARPPAAPQTPAPPTEPSGTPEPPSRAHACAPSQPNGDPLPSAERNARAKTTKAVPLHPLAVPAHALPTGVDLEERRATIRARTQRLDAEDFFEVLGVAREDPVDVVRSAYFALAKLWHPDRLPEALTDVRDDAARVFGKMSEAFHTLSDMDRRKDYFEKLATSKAGSDEHAEVQQAIEATIEFQKADVFVRKRDFQRALIHAKVAFERAPDQADHIALYAWVLAMQPEGRQTSNVLESIKLLQDAIARESRCERAHFYRAMLLKQMGQHGAALRDFRRAAELNPRNIDAARELRLAEMRGTTKDEQAPVPADPKAPPNDTKRAKDKVGEIFDKLFKRKP
ncbi:MAG: J domain-containing protein [Polyangiaceae bacterium]|nr:J domain-containing protein [Polyangiaceae bacterium]